MCKSLWVAAAAIVLFGSLSNLHAQEGAGGDTPPAARGQRGPGGGPGGPGGRRGGPGGGDFMKTFMSNMPLMKALDADGNGELSAQEIANASKALASIDKDGDGVLKVTEMMPDMSRMRGGRGGRGGGGRGGAGGRRGGPGGGPGGAGGGQRPKRPALDDE